MLAIGNFEEGTRTPTRLLKGIEAAVLHRKVEAPKIGREPQVVKDRAANSCALAEIAVSTIALWNARAIGGGGASRMPSNFKRFGPKRSAGDTQVVSIVGQ